MTPDHVTPEHVTKSSARQSKPSDLVWSKTALRGGPCLKFSLGEMYTNVRNPYIPIFLQSCLDLKITDPVKVKFIVVKATEGWFKLKSYIV